MKEVVKYIFFLRGFLLILKLSTIANSVYLQSGWAFGSAPAPPTSSSEGVTSGTMLTSRAENGSPGGGPIPASSSPAPSSSRRIRPSIPDPPAHEIFKSSSFLFCTYDTIRTLLKLIPQYLTRMLCMFDYFHPFQSHIGCSGELMWCRGSRT